MPDLILHLGFPKCASTTLQNKVFKGKTNYMGTYKGLPKRKNFAKQFKATTPVGPRQWSNFKQVKRWKDKVLLEYGSTAQPLILSDEMLTNKNKFTARPIISFLKKFNKEIWNSGTVKVVLVIRNYADRMASGYAQVSASNPFASQVDFEKKIKSNNSFHHDYAAWVKQLYALMGKENVLVLLMEETGSPKFWNSIKDFCLLEKFEPKSMISSTKNSKRTSSKSWKILPYSPERKANGLANNIFGFGWPSFIFPGPRSSAIKNAKEKLTAYYSKKYPHANANRESEITLHNDLRRHIQDYYKKSTKELSLLLEKDMRALGY